MWIPFFGTGTVAWGDAAYFVTGKSPVESYGFWCSACPSLNLLFDVREKGLDYDKIRQLTAQWREVMPYYYGDYYPLTKTTRDNDVWIAWQFDRPEQDDGIVQVFRRKESIYEVGPAETPRAGSRRRSIESPDRRRRCLGGGKMSGEELLQKGLPVSLSERPEAAVFQYQRVP